MFSFNEFLKFKSFIFQNIALFNSSIFILLKSIVFRLFKMHRGEEKKVYQLEDLSSLVDNVPEQLQDAVTQINYNIISHDAYNNNSYVWSKDDFELGTPLGKGL